MIWADLRGTRSLALKTIRSSRVRVGFGRGSCGKAGLVVVGFSPHQQSLGWKLFYLFSTQKELGVFIVFSHKKKCCQESCEEPVGIFFSKLNRGVLNTPIILDGISESKLPRKPKPNPPRETLTPLNHTHNKLPTHNQIKDRPKTSTKMTPSNQNKHSFQKCITFSQGKMKANKPKEHLTKTQQSPKKPKKTFAPSLFLPFFGFFASARRTAFRRFAWRMPVKLGPSNQAFTSEAVAALGSAFARVFFAKEKGAAKKQHGLEKL